MSEKKSWAISFFLSYLDSSNSGRDFLELLILKIIHDMNNFNDNQNGVSATPTVLHFHVTTKNMGQRLDMFLAGQPQLVEFTRSGIQGLIRDGQVLVNDLVRKTGYRLHADERITVNIPPLAPSPLLPEKVPFEVLYEDDDLVVLSKPPGIVVHPACGHQHGTLVHGLLYHCDNLSGISGEERPGIVHRLDKDTSGAMVVAKNDLAHHALIEQFKARTIKKKYRAVLAGHLSPLTGRIDSPIGRHPIHRKKMAVRPQNGREAVTTWQVQKEFPEPYTLVELGLETGRTHQIRVHMASLGCPVAGDSMYGKMTALDKDLGITRQCLHSYELSFLHPRSGQPIICIAPLWPDITSVIDKLEACDGHG